jgi:hypothetical protein
LLDDGERPDNFFGTWKQAWSLGRRLKQEGDTAMPVLIVPLLVGIPVVIGGGWVIYKVVGG